ncbi:MAG: Cysteinyl-tRNA synthetase-like protein [Streptosporangiaceae bacterium]|jgi:hypothetical protein|nr:Cysteinyl-tRNA synthetase-like protein [Streptosporangiaceae bacterium]
MLRLYDPRTGTVDDLPRSRLLRVHVSGPALRAHVLADVIRRLAERHRRQVMLTAEARTDLTPLNIPPADQGSAAESDLHVGGPGDAGRALPVGPSADEPSLPWVAAQGLDPLSVRLVTLERPYRAPLELDLPTLERADGRLRRLRAEVATWAEEPSKALHRDYLQEAVAALDEDLDTPGALEVLWRMAESGIPAGSKFETVSYLDMVLALDLVRDVGRPRPAAD